MKTRTEAFLNLLQTLAIVAGLAYGAIELTQFRNEQHRQAETEVARSFLSPDFMRAFSLILSMPDSLSWEALVTDYAEELPDLIFLMQTLETAGIMVFDGDVQLETVDEFMGTATILSWDKLSHPYFQYREENEAPTVAEWFQWLAERLQEYREGGAPPPAYEAHREWRPRG